MAEIEEHPKELRSKQFYPNEEYHYLDSKDRIERELKEFKIDIETKFDKASTKGYQFLRNDDTDSDATSDIEDVDTHESPPKTHRSKQMINYASMGNPNLTSAKTYREKAILPS